METFPTIRAEIQAGTEPRDVPQASRQVKPLPFSMHAAWGAPVPAPTGASCTPSAVAWLAGPVPCPWVRERVSPRAALVWGRKRLLAQHTETGVSSLNTSQQQDRWGNRGSTLSWEIGTSRRCFPLFVTQSHGRENIEQNYRAEVP